MAISSGSYIIFPLAYFELMPHFKCEYVDSFKNERVWSECQPSEFCNSMNYRMTSKHITQVSFDWSRSKSFHNYIERLNLECADHETIGMLGSMFFLGWAFTALFVPRLADIYGRKITFVCALLIQIPCIMVLILSHDVYLSMAALFIMGCCASGR